MANYDLVLKFWFEELQPKDWFNGGDAVDALIEKRFGDLIEPAYKGELDRWLKSPKGVLALIIILDQFPRNLFRGTPQAFAYDDRALSLALDGISLGLDETLEPIQRVFYYLPLEHSEDIRVQDRSVERYARLATQVWAEEDRSPFRNYLEYAWRHYSIIKRFGRYPHRNKILGRKSSKQEKAFLKEPGSSF